MDFESFIITGPSSLTTSTGFIVGGVPTTAAGLKASHNLGQCATDVFTVSGNTGVPPLCSTLTGSHGKSDELDSVFTSFR